MVRVYDHSIQFPPGSIPAINLAGERVRKYRLTLLFALTAVLIMVVAVFTVNHIIGRLAEDNLARIAEGQASRNALHIESMLHNSRSVYSSVLTGTPVEPDDLEYQNQPVPLDLEFLAGPNGLPAAYSALLIGSEIESFSLFDLDGTVEWSSDPSSVGTVRDDLSPIHDAIFQGVNSKFRADQEFRDAHGASYRSDVVETFLPLRRLPSGHVVGVLGITQRIGRDLALQVDRAKTTALWNTIATMGGLSLVLVGFILVADMTIHRSSRRQIALAEEARQSLETQMQEQVLANQRLESEIAKRLLVEGEQRRLAEEKQIVADIGQIISSTLNIEEVYEKFAREMKKMVDFDRVSINLIDQEAGTRTLKYLLGPAREGLPVGSVRSLQDTPSQTVLDTGQTLRREDAADDARYPSDLQHAKNGMRAAITVPLISKGRIIGTLVLRSKQVGAYGPKEQVILERMANQIAPAVANAQLYERIIQDQGELRKLSQDAIAEVEEKQIVAEIGQIIISTLNIDEVYEKFAHEMKKLVDFDRVSISLINQEAGTRTLKYLFGPGREDHPVGYAQSLQDTPSQTVLDTGQTLRREDAADDVRFPSDLQHAKNGMRAAITVPLISKGRIIGTMALRSKQVGAFGTREQAILEGLANQIAPAVANAQLYERTKHVQEEVHRLSQAVTTMNDGLLIVDLDGRIFFANPAAERMYGFEPGEMKGVEIWTLRSEANDITGHQIFEAVKAGEIWTGEIIARRKNGDEFPIRLSAAPVLDEEGQQICTMGLNTDITERKRWEQALKESEEEARQLAEGNSVRAEIGRIISSSTEFHEIFDRVSEQVSKLIPFDWMGTTTVDLERGTLTNDDTRGIDIPGRGQGYQVPIAGTLAEEMIRSRSSLVVHAEDETELAARYPALIPSFQAGLRSFLAVLLVFNDQVIGTLHLRSLQSNAYSDRHLALAESVGRQIAGAITRSRLYTESKRAQEALAKQAQELARSNSELQEFAYVASHDLQEPLRKVEAFGDRLRSKYGEALTDQGLDYLERMLNASGRMRTLINDLLSFSRVTTQAQPFVPVDLASLAAEVVSDLEATIDQSGGRVEVDHLPTIDGDPTQMRQLFQNLISNALKFHRPGEPPVVKVYQQFMDNSTGNGDGNHADDSACQVVVEDNGIGFDEKYLDRIFNVFQRLHGRDKYEGTGIGLAVCRKIAERHGGVITADSEPGRGAKFIVTLPTRQPEEE